MKLFRPSVVRRAAQEAIEALDLLTIDLNILKKHYLNGHHDIQVQSEVTLNPEEKKPNGTNGTDH